MDYVFHGKYYECNTQCDAPFIHSNLYGFCVISKEEESHVFAHTHTQREEFKEKMKS